MLMGGFSVEREVSLATGHECASALREEGFNVMELDAGRDLVERLCKLCPNVIFNALHGRWGEDGCVQGILEWLNLPYTHSGVLASSLAMDKQKSKEIFRRANIPVANSLVVSKEEIFQREVFDRPYVIKPKDEGSSYGVFFVFDKASLTQKEKANLPEEVMLEEYIRGRELTVAVMGEKALCVTEILTDGWYDYQAKYSEGGSKHVVPANIPEKISEACLNYALKAHNALGCKGLTRTDFRWDDEMGLEGLFLLETNTQPGMTKTSLCPEQAEVMGIDFPKLCRWILEDASCRR